MAKKLTVIMLVMLFTLQILTACGSSNNDSTDSTAEPVTLTIAGSWTECYAIEELGREFTKKYPNCTIRYEYFENFYASLVTRLKNDNTIDLFFTSSIQDKTEAQIAATEEKGTLYPGDLLPYAVDFSQLEGLDLSNTFEALINNFKYVDDEGNTNKLYSIPLGAEMRGLFVNKTLLNKYNLSVPTDQESLLAVCKTLKENGLIAFQGNPGSFAQTLLYPWVCNDIANAINYQEVYDKVNNREAGFSEIFKDVFEFMYLLVEEGYYDYKYSQDNLGLSKVDNTDGKIKDFFNIAQDAETKEYSKVDDIGKVAFLPSAVSTVSDFAQAKEDYHSNIEYEFMPAPIGKNGGFVYLSPAHGIGANKNSENLEWVTKLLNYLYTPENNEVFAENFNIMPNTKGVFDYCASLYEVPSTNISHLGQVTFDYVFYNKINNSLTEISKCNNPKYFENAGKDNAAMYQFSYFWNKLEDSFKDA